MQRVHKIIIGIVCIAIVLVVLNAKPLPRGIATARTVDTYSDMFFSYTEIRYPAKVEVVKMENSDNITLGIDVGTDEFDFSRLAAGSSVRKTITLSSRDNLPSKIIAEARGNIAPMIRFEKNNFVITGNDTLPLVMDSAGFGNYTGEVSVVIQRSRFDLLRNLLGY
jgi:hypothetical protein